MNIQYNLLKKEFEIIKMQLSSSFENSILYQKEVIDFLKNLNTLSANYSEIVKYISSLNTKYEEKNYSKVFSNLDEVKTNLNNLSIAMEPINEKIKNASNLTYNNLLTEFKNKENIIQNKLQILKKSIDDYDKILIALKTIDINDINYSIKNNTKAHLENQINDYIRNIKNSFLLLKKLLNKGLKRS